MYVPAHFKQDDVGLLHETIRRIGFGTLVTQGGDGLDASHVPMLVETAPAPHGALIGHVARANPVWRTAQSEAQALAIFLGPDAYVSPGWYPTKAESGKVVPTWNYVAVHAAGTLRFFDDPERLRALVTKLTEAHEAGRAVPWAVSDAPEDYIRGMLKAIVGFELTISRLEGKWKMSQNRPAQDRAGVVQGLTREGAANQTAVANIVSEVSRTLP